MRGLPSGIGARLFCGFLIAAVPALLAAGWLLEGQARRALEGELGRRAEALALAVGASIPAETWELLFALGPGEEDSRIARHLRRRLQEVERATGAERIAAWTETGALILDSRAELPIGSRAPRAELLAAELRRAAAGSAASTPLFRSERGRRVKLGLAPLWAGERAGEEGGARAGERAGEEREAPAAEARAEAPAEERTTGATAEATRVATRVATAEATAEATVEATAERALLGVLVVEAPETSLGAVSAMRSTLLLVGAAGVLLVAVAAALLAGALTRRLERLAAAARRMERGDLDAPLAGFGRDEIGALAGALEAMRGAVRLREQHLRAMLGGVSHEIRNPLGGLLLNAELLERDAALPAPARRRARRILEEAAHLDGVVGEFLAFARPERPEAAAEALDELARESARSAVESLRWPGSLEQSLEPLRVVCDAGHARRILVNLLLNAMQAAGEAGRVELSLRATEQGALLCVADSGPGIPPEARERVFEPFYSTRAQGAGLGLAIVRRLCELGGIGLELDQGPLGGARFTLRWGAGREG